MEPRTPGRKRRDSNAPPAPPKSLFEGPLKRNDTSFPVRVATMLKALYKRYVAARLVGDKWATLLKYYQYLCRAVMTDPNFGIGLTGNARGLLVWHTMGMGKTLLAAAVMMALWDVRDPVVILPRSLQGNFGETVSRAIAIIHSELGPEEVRRMQDAAARRLRFVSMDAYNAADQIARVGTAEGVASLDGKLLIVDEAHNLSRAIINNPSEAANGRRIYDMVMDARNLRILFLTGTPASKDPFELVPLFNMLAGWDLLPPQYEVFYRLYVDKAARRVKNRSKLANRIMGLVSHVTHTLPTVPPETGDDTTQVGDQGMKPRAAGGFPEELPTIIEHVEMAPDQYRLYLVIREKEDAEGKGGEGGPRREQLTGPAMALPGSEKKTVSSYYVRSRAVSNFMPPRGTGIMAVEMMPDEAFTAETSPKAALLVQRVEKSPGSALVYSQFRERGGIKVIARFLQKAGYTEYKLPTTQGGGQTFSDGARTYSVEQLWRLAAALPEEEIPTASLEWMLDDPCWSSETEPGLSPREVLVHPNKYPDHAARIEAADFEFPVLLVKRRYPDDRGDDIIADGMHRLAKAARDQMPFLRAQKLSPAVLDIAVVSDIRADIRADVTGPASATGAAETPIIDEETEEDDGLAASEPPDSVVDSAPPADITAHVVAVPQPVDVPAPAKRYAIISGQIPLKDRLRLQAIFNSPENIRGAVIRVLLVTKTGAEGLDLKNVRQTHQFEPYWDKARDAQFTARAVRIGSHDALPVEDRDVQPFLYMSVANRKVKEATPEENREAKTIDEQFHDRALLKFELIQDFRSLLRSVSLECSVMGYPDCRLCVPTGEPLFYVDAVQDIKLADPCDPVQETDLEATPITVTGKDGTPKTYYYIADPSEPLGYRFFEHSTQLDGYAPLDPSDPIVGELLAALVAQD